MTRLFTMADHVRTALQRAALASGISLPTEQYITTGQAVHDCEQVAIVATAARTGLPPGGQFPNGVPGSATAMGCDPAWSALIGIEIVRKCAPVPNARGVVAKAMYEANAKIASDDVELLIETLPYLREHQIGNFDCSMALPPIDGGFLVVKAQLTVAI